MLLLVLLGCCYSCVVGFSVLGVSEKEVLLWLLIVTSATGYSLLRVG